MSTKYKAKIIGEFKENQYPNDEILELKAGAQIMFIRNDATADHKYYNGKLAEVIRLDEDEITVLIEGSTDEYKLKKEVWEQKKYSLDGQKNIQEEVLGSFEQYPIRLAWAVTIHKSQGLTLEKVIFHYNNSLSKELVYVACSRVTSYDWIYIVK
mgnify:CR=1 FL=1